MESFKGAGAVAGKWGVAYGRRCWAEMLVLWVVSKGKAGTWGHLWGFRARKKWGWAVFEGE